MEALQCGGVDNWNDYCDSINRYREEEEKRRGKKFEYWDEFIEDVINEIE